MDRLILQVVPDPDSHDAELEYLAYGLRDELSKLDVPPVRLLAADEVPGTAKGAGLLFGWLVTQFETLDGLRDVITAVGTWVGRTGRSVEVSVNGDTLKVARATAAQQEDLVNAWLSRHGSSS